MNAERFQMLIETLERPRPPEIIFDMRTWGSPTYVFGYVCGTAACAAGLYVGLSLHDRSALPGFQACARYWDITRQEATFLFSPGGYDSESPTKNEVLDRVRKFYEEGEAKK